MALNDKELFADFLRKAADKLDETDYPEEIFQLVSDIEETAVAAKKVLAVGAKGDLERLAPTYGECVSATGG